MSFISNPFCILLSGLLPILLGSSILLWWWRRWSILFWRGRRWFILFWLGGWVVFLGGWMVASDGGCVVTPRCGVASVLSITSVWPLRSWSITAHHRCMVTSPSGGIVTSLSCRLVASVPILAWLTTILAILGWRRSSILVCRRAVIIHVILTFVGI